MLGTTLSFWENSSEQNQIGTCPLMRLEEDGMSSNICTNKNKIAPMKNTTREKSRVLGELVVDLI